MIDLNVGGTKYSTTLSTLTKYPKSMLGAMFLGQIPSQLDKNKNYFIDRDGEIFRYILQYLRSGEVTLPKEHKNHSLLQSEALFYQIQPLIEVPTLVEEPIIERQKEMITIYFPQPFIKKHYCLSVDNELYRLVHSRKIVDFENDDHLVDEDSWIQQKRSKVFSRYQLGSYLLIKGFNEQAFLKLDEECEDYDKNNFAIMPLIVHHYKEAQNPTDDVSTVSS